MANIEIKVKQLDDCSLLWDDECDDFDFEVVERSGWEDEGKYQHKSVILKRLSDGTFWRWWETRSGSYFTEYYYGSDDEDVWTFTQVKPKEVTVTEWENVEAAG